MNCPRCGHENAADYLFCEECGEQVQQECPDCGHLNSLEHNYCEECGHAFKGAATGAGPRQVADVQPVAQRRFPRWAKLLAGAAGLGVIALALYLGMDFLGGRAAPPPPVVDVSLNQPQPTETARRVSASSDSQEASAAQEDSEPATEESGPEPAMFTVNQETNCRYGASASQFDVRRTIFNGQTVPIVGVGAPPAQEWWVVEVDGVECWVWAELGAASGDTEDVPAVSPPATPTPAPPTPAPTKAPELDPCKADYWVESIKFLDQNYRYEMVLGTNGKFLPSGPGGADYWHYLEEKGAGSAYCTTVSDQRLKCEGYHNSQAAPWWISGNAYSLELEIEFWDANKNACKINLPDVVVP